MKRINEAQLRLIVKEELTKLLTENETGSMSILPSDVSPELFVKNYKLFWGRIAESRYFYKNRFNPQQYVKYFTSLGELTQQEAEEWVKLIQMCMEGETYKFNSSTVIPIIAKALKMNKDDSFKLYDILRQIVGDPRPNISSVIAMGLAEPQSRDTQLELKQVKNKLNAETMEKQINFINSMNNFTEPKELSDSHLDKLKSMITDIDGLIQAAELYGML